jgi:curved DNA-binding protein CbpA
MDYYEELGLKRTATVQEIRRAYKLLAKLVHPDGQANEPVRDMAERQMKRLNQILATLTNAQARREYDAGLQNGAALNRVAAPPVGLWHAPAGEFREPNRRMAIPEWLQPVAENWFWVALALIVVGVGVWYLAQARTEDGMPAAVSPAVEEKAPPVEPRRPKSAAPRQVEAKAVPRSQASREASTPEMKRQPARRTASAARSTDPPVAAIPRETPAPETSRTPAVAPAMAPPVAAKTEPAGALPAAGATKPRSSPFTGNWLYVPDPSEKSAPGAYPASYVELLMGEEHGRLRGTYRAEYRVTDRAVSPEVAFQVEGDAPAESTAHLQWTATDGAKGDVDLALSGPNVLKITWWTTEFGRHSKLASGTSKLIRQLSR